MESFIHLTDEAANRYEEYRDAPSPSTQAGLRQITFKAESLFDLSLVAPAKQASVADETFYLFWDVIGRVELPETEDIPNATSSSTTDDEADRPVRWRIPGTDIQIVLVTEGQYKGEYRFSPNTVRQARRFYELVRELPYVRPMHIENLQQRNERFSGWMIPVKWVESLPEWLSYQFQDMPLWKWVVLMLLLGLNLFADRPVRVGDLCSYTDKTAPGWRPVGRVESVGLRSTKIRRLDRS